MGIHRFWKSAWLAGAAILFCIFAGGAWIWTGLSMQEQKVLISLLEANIYPVICIFFMVAGSLWMFLDIVYSRYVLSIKQISAEAAMIYDTNPSHRIRIKGDRDIVRLCEIINDFALLFQNLNQTIISQIQSARMEIEKERNLLAAIMNELPHGIVICTLNGCVLLLNALARDLLSQDDQDSMTTAFLGVGRSLFRVIDRAYITHATQEICEQIQNNDASVGSFFITPVKTGRLISAQVLPVLDEKNVFKGFILVIEDASVKIKKYQGVDKELYKFSNLLDASIKDSPSLKDEFNLLSKKIRENFFSTLPATRIALNKFLPAIQKKLGYFENIRINVYNPFPESRFLADTYSMTQAFVFILRKLGRLTHTLEFDLSVQAGQEKIEFRITWTGLPCPIQGIDGMLETRLSSLPALGYILRFNNTYFIPVQNPTGDCIGLRLCVRSCSPGKERRYHAPVLSSSRPEFYDFDLFRYEEAHPNLTDTPLSRLTCTVFDTETTGLDIHGGDEIISIGAVRIVNQRVVYQDGFDRLVNPLRDIPAASCGIHGITNDMVKDKPPLKDVLKAFSTYAGDSVLVGHNVAFDLKMFKVKEKETGICFDNPVLDTLILSSLLYPAHDRHDLEAVAERLGICLAGRHTAIGDARITAAVYLKLIPILETNGLFTLKEALAASKRSYYARLNY